METLTITNEINETIEDIYKFAKTNDAIKEDYIEYTKTMGIYNSPEEATKEYYIPYIFERNIPELNKTPLEVFNETQSNEISKSLTSSFTSLFRIKRVLKGGFEVYNVINEKNYTLNATFKMTEFRGFGIGQFIVARVFNYQNSFYIIELTGHLPESKKDDAMRYAMAKIIHEPYLVYEDNAQKEEEIKSNIAKMYDKFQDAFHTDEIITMNKFADEIIGEFNEYVENGTPLNLDGKIEEPKELKYFESVEFDNDYDNFVEKSLQGFSSHKKPYDVGIIYDKENGLYVVPFYKTLTKILEDNSLETVENAKDCIKYFLTSDKISDSILKRIYAKYPNFLELANKAEETNLTFDEILHKHKKMFLTHKIYSQTAILYSSSVFTSTIDSAIEKEEKSQYDYTNVGRNDPCPCGSGKKFKHCCGR